MRTEVGGVEIKTIIGRAMTRIDNTLYVLSSSVTKKVMRTSPVQLIGSEPPSTSTIRFALRRNSLKLVISPRLPSQTK